jgi:hypothetical protein
MAARDEFPTVVELIEARDATAGLRVKTDLVELEASGIAPEPLLSGEGLIAAGLAPGPSFKHILESTYDAQLEGDITTPDEALAHALKIARSAQGDG